MINGIKDSYMTSRSFPHVGNSLSPLQVAQPIAIIFNLDRSLILETTFEKYFARKARPPQWAQVLSKKNNFYKMKSFEQGLDQIKKQISL